MNDDNLERCKICGGSMIGDGYSVVRHCENANDEDYWNKEPDAKAVYCSINEKKLEEK